MVRVHLINGEIVNLNGNIKTLIKNINNFESKIPPVTMTFNDCIIIINNILYIDEVEDE